MKTSLLVNTSRQQFHALARELGIAHGLTCPRIDALGEVPYISLPGFRQVLTQFQITHSTQQLRLWLPLPRTHLPATLQVLLCHAPERWYLLRTRGRGGRNGRRYAIPLSFLSPDAQDFVRTRQLVRKDISDDTLIHTIRALLGTNPGLRSTDIHRHFLREGFSIHYQAVRKAVGTIKLRGLYATLGHDPSQPADREPGVQRPVSPAR